MASKFDRFESSLLQRENTARERVQSTSLIWTNWNSDWERSGPSWITPSLRQPFVSGVVAAQRASTHGGGNSEHRLPSFATVLLVFAADLLPTWTVTRYLQANSCILSGLASCVILQGKSAIRKHTNPPENVSMILTFETINFKTQSFRGQSVALVHILEAFHELSSSHTGISMAVNAQPWPVSSWSRECHRCHEDLVRLVVSNCDEFH